MPRTPAPARPNVSLCIDRIRQFERIYERYLRRCRRSSVNEDLTLSDIEVLHELGLSRDGACGSWIAATLDVDSGYLCRILKKLEAYQLLEAEASPSDRRSRLWKLTAEGLAFSGSIEEQFRQRVERTLADLPPVEQQQLAEALATIEAIL